MKSLGKRRNAKLLAAVSFSIFSLGATLTGTFAWFLANTSVQAKSFNIAVYADDTLISFSIYKYDTTRDGPVCLTGNDATNFFLNQYDVVFKERNKYNPAYIEMDLSGASLKTSGSVNITLERNVACPVMDNNNLLSNYFTSVTKYAADANGAIVGGIHNQDVSTTWDNLNAAFSSKDASGLLSTQSFTSGTTGNYVKSSNLQFVVNYDESDIVDGRLIIYLYINYDATLSETYSLEHGLSTSSVGGTSNYSLLNDLSTIHITRD